MSGEVTGTSELWLESAVGGTVVHYYLRVDPASGRPLRARRLDRLRRAHAVRWKRHVWALKDALETGRAPGEPAA